MLSETTVTIGMLTTVSAVAFSCWQVFKYVGQLENRLELNARNLIETTKHLEERDRRLLREMKRHRMIVKDVESFLSKNLDYNIRPFIEMEEKGF